MAKYFIIPIIISLILAIIILSWQQEVYDRKIIELQNSQWEQPLKDTYRNGWILGIGVIIIGITIAVRIYMNDKHKVMVYT